MYLPRLILADLMYPEIGDVTATLFAAYIVLIQLVWVNAHE